MSPSPRRLRHAVSVLSLGLVTVGSLAAFSPAEADVRAKIVRPCATTDGKGPVLDRSNVDYHLTGNCRLLTITGDNVSVDLFTATTVVMEGTGNMVVGNTIGTARLRGDAHRLEANTLQRLRLRADRSTVSVTHQIERAKVVGRHNTVATRDARVVKMVGNRNRVVATASTVTRLRGNRNVVRMQSLDTLRVRGNRNKVVVATGSTKVTVSGRRNTTP